MLMDDSWTFPFATQVQPPIISPLPRLGFTMNSNKRGFLHQDLQFMVTMPTSTVVTWFLLFQTLDLGRRTTSTIFSLSFESPLSAHLVCLFIAGPSFESQCQWESLFPRSLLSVLHCASSTTSALTTRAG